MGSNNALRTTSGTGSTYQAGRGFRCQTHVMFAIPGGGAAEGSAAITAAEILGANKRVVVFKLWRHWNAIAWRDGGRSCNFTNADLTLSFSHQSLG